MGEVQEAFRASSRFEARDTHPQSCLRTYRLRSLTGRSKLIYPEMFARFFTSSRLFSIRDLLANFWMSIRACFRSVWAFVSILDHNRLTCHYPLSVVYKHCSFLFFAYLPTMFERSAWWSLRVNVAGSSPPIMWFIYLETFQWPRSFFKNIVHSLYRKQRNWKIIVIIYLFR